MTTIYAGTATVDQTTVPHEAGNPLFTRALPAVTDADRKAAFQDRLDHFVALSQAIIVTHTRANFPNLTPGELEVDPGRRYVRIWCKAHGSRSAWAFVDKTNGDILKPASWRAPAKHARGNIFDANPVANTGAYGPHYIRGPIVG
jgi:hypothetical protein